jgi:hypothetical protein
VGQRINPQRSERACLWQPRCARGQVTVTVSQVRQVPVRRTTNTEPPYFFSFSTGRLLEAQIFLACNHDLSQLGTQIHKPRLCERISVEPGLLTHYSQQEQKRRCIVQESNLQRRTPEPYTEWLHHDYVYGSCSRTVNQLQFRVSMAMG